MKEDIVIDEDLVSLGLSGIDFTKKSDAELFGYKNEEWEQWLDFQRWENDEEFDNYANLRDGSSA